MGKLTKWFLKKHDLMFGKHPDESLKLIYELVKRRSRMVVIYKEKGWSYKKVFIDIKNVYTFEKSSKPRKPK
jgi:hypothetical protein